MPDELDGPDATPTRGKFTGDPGEAAATLAWLRKQLAGAPKPALKPAPATAPDPATRSDTRD